MKSLASLLGRRVGAQREDLADGVSMPGRMASPTSPPMATRRRLQPRARAWVAVLAGLLTAVAATFGILGLYASAAEHSEARWVLNRLETHVRHLSAVEWERVAERQLRQGGEIEEDPVEVEAELFRTAEQLRRMRGGGPGVSPLNPVQGGEEAGVDAVMDTYVAYRRVARAQFERLATGDLSHAGSLDEQLVDPAFDRFTEALADAGATFEADAAQARRNADMGTVALVLVAGTILGGLVWRFQRAQASAAELLSHQALHDGLTGLPNRLLLRDRISQAIRQADRELNPAALLMIDLDRFKEVNDTLGHHYGDQLLIQVSARLQAALRSVDTVARLGGDEFVILLPRIAAADGAVAVAEKLQAALEGPFELEGLTLNVEASIGLALYPDHGSDPDELLQRADIAMYVAKETHAGFVLFDAKLDRHSPRRLALLGELRTAIDQRQLILHYQPKVDAQTSQVLGVEALVRWQHPEHGLIPPNEFVPLAERTGLITPLTHYVLEAALRQCHQWCEAGHEMAMAVNVSARRLLDLGFPDEVAGLLAICEVPSRLLIVEITESTIMADPDHALQILQRLDEMGVRISIDDFGTGYSSMAYLKSLPVHELKVDRSFVSQMTSSTSDAVIVRSTVDLGRNLGLKVVAEGVEDLTTWQQLEALGCDVIQGYYVSRPVPAAELTTWLEQRMPMPIPGTIR